MDHGVSPCLFGLLPPTSVLCRTVWRRGSHEKLPCKSKSGRIWTRDSLGSSFGSPDPSVATQPGGELLTLSLGNAPVQTAFASIPAELQTDGYPREKPPGGARRTLKPDELEVPASVCATIHLTAIGWQQRATPPRQRHRPGEASLAALGGPRGPPFLLNALTALYTEYLAKSFLSNTTCVAK